LQFRVEFVLKCTWWQGRTAKDEIATINAIAALPAVSHITIPPIVDPEVRGLSPALPLLLLSPACAGR